jgi:hypothetical protein
MSANLCTATCRSFRHVSEHFRHPFLDAPISRYASTASSRSPIVCEVATESKARMKRFRSGLLPAASEPVVVEEVIVYFMGVIGAISFLTTSSALHLAGAFVLVAGVICISLFAGSSERLAGMPRILRLTGTGKLSNLARAGGFSIVAISIPLALYFLDNQKRIGGLTFFGVYWVNGLRTFYGIWKSGLGRHPTLLRQPQQ